MVTKIHVPKKLYYGARSFDKLGEAVTSLGINHLFVILSERAKNELHSTIDAIAKVSSFTVTYCTHFSEEPTTLHVSQISKRFQDSGANGILGIGGGSALDLAKAVAILAKEKDTTIQTLQFSQRLERYPLIAIPTTAGSGSEATKILVITDVNENVKYNPKHETFIPDIAILDPYLSLDLPQRVTAQTGIDALAHAMEAYVSTKASLVSDVYALEAIQLIATSLTKVYNSPHDITSRERMLLASYFAGIAFSNSSTNLAHATARPLGTRFNLPHGLSVALTLPPVIQFGHSNAKERYETIAQLLQTNDLVQFISDLNESFNIYNDANQLIDIEQLKSETATLVQDALAGNGIVTNRKIPTEEDVTNVYKQIIQKLMEVS